MPIRERCRAMSLSVRTCSLPLRSSMPMSSPPTQILPPVRISIWLIRRKNVVLPDPLGPSRSYDFLGVDGEVNPLQHLVGAERFGDIDSAYEVVGLCRCGGHFAPPIARPLAASSLSELTWVPNPRPNLFSR